MSPAPGSSGAGVPALLVLGLGNSLLGDDAAGLELLAACERSGPAAAFPGGVEYVDGGTQGIALLGVLAGRRALLLLDAVKLGDPPGTVHELTGAEAMALRFTRPETAHEGGAGQVLAIAALTGDLPQHVRVVGIEPESVETRLGLSPAVAAALPRAAERAGAALAALAAACAGEPGAACTS